MKLVQHPNVVRLYEVIDTQTKLYLVLELADGGDLYDYIMRHDAGEFRFVFHEYGLLPQNWLELFSLTPVQKGYRLN